MTRLPLVMSVFLCALTACASTTGTSRGTAQQRTESSAQKDHIYTRGAVAADHRIASRAGVEMLIKGGNAVDAAVATSFTLSVVRPYSCGIGGGGFMVISFPAQDGEGNTQCLALNYREVAPAGVDADYYIDLAADASCFGPHAVGVPGTVAGLLYALKTHGTLDREAVLAPAIRAAEEGVPADANFVEAAHHIAELRSQHPHLRKLTEPIWRELCLNGRIKIGDIIRQPGKAKALRLIAEHGAAAFYQGDIADAIVETIQEAGGVMSHRDLDAYAIDITEPLRGSFLGYELLTMPPPSSGGIALVQMLGFIEQHLGDLESAESGYRQNDPSYIHLVAEAMKHAFADRAEHLADPLFVQVPADRLISEPYIEELASRFDAASTLDDPYAYGSVTPAGAIHSTDGGTSHLSVIDADGMAVACTETVNLIYGSLMYVEEFGIVLNNEMDDFTTIPGAPNAFGLQQSDRNLPEPGKRPLSSMSPTIVLSDGRPILILGASGGPRIITATVQGILNSLLFDMQPREAVSRPRFHHQWMPQTLMLEPALEPQRAAMEDFGHATGAIDTVGVMQMITIDEAGVIRAASDPRKGGQPAGW